VAWPFSCSAQGKEGASRDLPTEGGAAPDYSSARGLERRRGRLHREVGTAVAALCERGYAGGLVFRQKQQLGTSQPAVSSALPGVVTAA
jgi:hypothetical protein